MLSTCMPLSSIGGRYEIKEVLGQGGMGVVYKAYDSHRKGFVALKTMKDVADAASLELFAQEWRTLANISHPNIVDVLDSGEFEEESQRKPYFVMPLLPGKTLDRLIRDISHRVTVERTVEILIQTCRGLQAAHAGGLIHRDLKPSNLFVMSDDSVKIIDFGMVHLADSRKSITGIKGTLHYMAPEQIEMKDVTPATDIFSLGVVAYEAFTNRKPFDRGSEAATVQAIRKEFPPPASDLNPNVSKALAQVVAKALAKGPWNRFESAREFGEHLQRALRREPIELFDVARIQPRIERARRALIESDFEYANEILNELQLEGHVDAEISLLLEQVNEATRGKVIRQLLDSARTRMQEEEYPLAWQKIQEALQKDPGNREAQALQAEIETRRSDQQMDKWRRLVHQHLHNHAFTQARDAIEEIRKIKPDDVEVGELTAEVLGRETEFRRVCDEKEREFQSAMRSYGSGEISTALSKLKKILELETGTPGFIVPERDEVYRETYNKIRSERDEVLNAVAEIEKNIASGNIARATELSSEQSAKYPNDFALQALKLKVEDLQRQGKSAYIAEIGRRVDAEPDLDRGVKCLEEALERYPNEPHFQELAASLRKRRDLVNSIVLKARQYEEQNLVIEALSQWNTLCSVYPQYPGLNFEIERVQRRGEQRRRDESKLSWVDRIDRLLQTGEHDRAHDLSVEALSEFPGDQELQSLKRLALEGRERSAEAMKLMEQAQGLTSNGEFPEAIELLRRAVNLDPNQATVRETLANGLVRQAQALLSNDWRAAEPLIQEALRVSPAHALAKSLRPSVLLAKRMEFVDQCVAQARELQTAGDVAGALAKVQEGLATYPNDSRLVQLQNALRNTIGEQGHLRRSRDLEELRRLSQEAEQARDQTSLTALLERSVVLSQLYPEDQEVAGVLSGIRERSELAPKPDGVAPPPAAPPEQVPPVSGKSANDNKGRQLGSRVATPFENAWKWVKSRSRSLGPRTQGLSRTQRGGLAAILVVVVAGIVAGPAIRRFIDRRKGHGSAIAQQEVAITFAVNPEGATLVVDGNPLTGTAANLLPGQHSVTAAKEGYKRVVQTFTVEGDAAPVKLQLEPEPHVIRVSADVPGAKVLLDGTEIGPLQDGFFSYPLAGGGPHTLKLVNGRNEVFSVEFQAEPGAPAKLVAAPTTRDLPIVVVSNLGSHAWVYSSVKEMRAALKSGDPQSIPPEGRDLTLLPADNEVTFDDGKKPMSFPVEGGNAPVLSIRAGISTKGTLAIEASADGARVYINGRESSGSIKRGKWSKQLEPGDYKIQLRLDGYDDTAEQTQTVVAGKVAVLRFEMKPATTSAFLTISGGTPEAEVWVDDQKIGVLDSSGSFGPKAVTPDAEHAIRLHKEYYEDFKATRRAKMKESIPFSVAEGQLKPFGTLVFEVQPPETQVTVHQQGEAAQKVDKTVRLREGTYIVTGTAGGYEPYQNNAVQIASGQSRTIPVVLTHKEKPKNIDPGPPPKRREVKELFDSTITWDRRDDGFWLHNAAGGAYLNDTYFDHVFEALKIKKKGILKGQEKIHWLVYLDTRGDDYIDCEVDGSDFRRRLVIGGETTETRQYKIASEKELYRVNIRVAEDGVFLKIGNTEDVIHGKVAGRTGFVGKFGLRLVK